MQIRSSDLQQPLTDLLRRKQDLSKYVLIGGKFHSPEAGKSILN